ncbi:MAG: hypothetical protein ABI336_05070 [Humibacillus sp.]
MGRFVWPGGVLVGVGDGVVGGGAGVVELGGGGALGAGGDVDARGEGVTVRRTTGVVGAGAVVVTTGAAGATTGALGPAAGVVAEVVVTLTGLVAGVGVAVVVCGSSKASLPVLETDAAGERAAVGRPSRLPPTRRATSSPMLRAAARVTTPPTCRLRRRWALRWATRVSGCMEPQRRPHGPARG